MQKIYIVGVGMTPFTRHPDLSVKQLTQAAVSAALDDAACGATDVRAAFYGNCAQGYLEGQHLVRGQVALLPLGFQGIPVINVENACATASTALHMAYHYLRSGACDVAMAVGSDKMYTTDKALRFGIFDSAWDVQTPGQNHRSILDLGEGVTIPEGSMSASQYSPFMDVYASWARLYIRKFGITQRQLAVIASKNRRHAQFNDRAQFRQPLTVEEVLHAPPISYPLTLPMCSPISDGAAAAILCNEDGLRRLRAGTGRAVEILASVMRAASKRDGDDIAHHLARLAANDAYEIAGLAPADMDVCEVHDATAMGELMQTENLGFCAPGDGGLFAESGATEVGGSIPVNPSGGLEAKGHPIGATGLGQVFELVSQLRGECGARQVSGARLAIQENGGGIWGVEEAVAHIGIYARVSPA